MARLPRLLIVFWFLFVGGCSRQGFGEGPPSEKDSVPDYHCDPAGPDVASEDADIVIYVVSLGWHTGILIPSDKVTGPLRSQIPEFTRSPFVEIGWGDEEFYRGSGDSIWSGFRAAFFSHSSTLHVAGFKSLKLVGLRHLKAARLHLSQAGFAQLENAILDSIALDADGQVIRLGDSLYGRGSFYRATGDFSILHTCNSWTSEVIEKAGCQINGSRRAWVLMKQLSAGTAAGEQGSL